MRGNFAIVLLICGTALVIMPQIHSAVFGANYLYAAAIVSHRPGAAAPVADVSPPKWMAPASAGLGGVLILVAMVGAAGSARAAARAGALT